MTHLPGDLLSVIPGQGRPMLWPEHPCEAEAMGDFVSVDELILFLAPGDYALVLVAGQLGYVLSERLQGVGP